VYAISFQTQPQVLGIHSTTKLEKKVHTLSQNLIIQPWALPNFTSIIVIVQNQIKNCN
jgi:hypothetical protein